MYPGSLPLIFNGSVPGHEKLFNVRRCSMYAGVQFDRFHCNFHFALFNDWLLNNFSLTNYVRCIILNQSRWNLIHLCNNTLPSLCELFGIWYSFFLIVPSGPFSSARQLGQFLQGDVDASWPRCLLPQLPGGESQESPPRTF